MPLTTQIVSAPHLSRQLSQSLGNRIVHTTGSFAANIPNSETVLYTIAPLDFNGPIMVWGTFEITNPNAAVSNTFIYRIRENDISGTILREMSPSRGIPASCSVPFSLRWIPTIPTKAYAITHVENGGGNVPRLEEYEITCFLWRG